jgi:hypothetical protein
MMFYVSLHSANPTGSNFWERQHGARLMPRPDITVTSSTPRHSATTRSVAARSSAIALPDVPPAPDQILASVVAACAGNKKPRLGGRGLVRGNVRRKPDLVVGESATYDARFRCCRQFAWRVIPVPARALCDLCFQRVGRIDAVVLDIRPRGVNVDEDR